LGGGGWSILPVEGITDDLLEAAHSDPREAEDVHQEVRKVPVRKEGCPQHGCQQ
jgi:hypothetical protein